MGDLKNNEQSTFEIPEELAKELSDLLTRQSIKMNLLQQVIDQPDKYEKVENMLMPITSKIDAIKAKITMEYVPEEFNSPEYVWNYNGWDIDKNLVHVLKS